MDYRWCWTLAVHLQACLGPIACLQPINLWSCLPHSRSGRLPRLGWQAASVRANQRRRTAVLHPQRQLGVAAFIWAFQAFQSAWFVAWIYSSLLCASAGASLDGTLLSLRCVPQYEDFPIERGLFDCRIALYWFWLGAGRVGFAGVGDRAVLWLDQFHSFAQFLAP